MCTITLFLSILLFTFFPPRFSKFSLVYGDGVPGGSYGGPTIYQWRDSYFHSTNHPGGREYAHLFSSRYSTDTLILAGGKYSHREYTDVWLYSLSINEWAHLFGWFNNEGTIDQVNPLEYSSSLEKPATYGDTVHYHPFRDTLVFYGGYIDMSGYSFSVTGVYEFDLGQHMYRYLHGTWHSNHTYHSGVYPSDTDFHSYGEVVPRSRYYSNSWVYDKYMYFFGGVHSWSSDMYVSDMWVLDMDSFEYKYAHGPEEVNSGWVIGEVDVYSESNVPKGRMRGMCWVYRDELYLYGGGVHTNVHVSYNDLWRFSVELDQWRLTKGNPVTTIWEYQNYKGYDDDNITPVSQMMAVVSTGETVFMFGGASGCQDDWNSLCFKNTLWVFNNELLQFRFVHGDIESDNLLGNFTLQIPGGIKAAAAAFVGDNLYFFGGRSYYNDVDSNLFNSLWKYDAKHCGNYNDFTIKEQCGGNGVCLENICKCKKDYKLKSGKCVKKTNVLDLIAEMWYITILPEICLVCCLLGFIVVTVIIFVIVMKEKKLKAMLARHSFSKASEDVDNQNEQNDENEEEKRLSKKEEKRNSKKEEKPKNIEKQMEQKKTYYPRKIAPKLSKKHLSNRFIMEDQKRQSRLIEKELKEGLKKRESTRGVKPRRPNTPKSQRGIKPPAPKSQRGVKPQPRSQRGVKPSSVKKEEEKTKSQKGIKPSPVKKKEEKAKSQKGVKPQPKSQKGVKPGKVLKKEEPKRKSKKKLFGFIDEFKCNQGDDYTDDKNKTSLKDQFKCAGGEEDIPLGGGSKGTSDGKVNSIINSINVKANAKKPPMNKRLSKAARNVQPRRKKAPPAPKIKTYKKMVSKRDVKFKYGESFTVEDVGRRSSRYDLDKLEIAKTMREQLRQSKLKRKAVTGSEYSRYRRPKKKLPKRTSSKAEIKVPKTSSDDTAKPVHVAFKSFSQRGIKDSGNNYFSQRGIRPSKKGTKKKSFADFDHFNASKKEDELEEAKFKRIRRHQEKITSFVTNIKGLMGKDDRPKKKLTMAEWKKQHNIADAPLKIDPSNVDTDEFLDRKHRIGIQDWMRVHGLFEKLKNDDDYEEDWEEKVEKQSMSDKKKRIEEYRKKLRQKIKSGANPSGFEKYVKEI